jgi:hypothetical protein
MFERKNYENNNMMNLLLQENFERSTVSHDFNKIRPKMFQREHKIDIQKLDETPHQLLTWIQNIETYLFHVDLISYRNTVL